MICPVACEFCWVPFPRDPSLPLSCSQVSMKRISSLCPSCCQPILCHQSLSFPLTTVVVIWLIYSLLCQHCLRKIKRPVYALSLPLLSDAVLNVDYKVWSFFPGVGHWQVTAFFCSLFLPACEVGMVLAPCYMGLCGVPFSSSSSFITYSCPAFLISGQVSFLQDVNPVTMELA